jgi:ribosome-associated protein
MVRPDAKPRSRRQQEDITLSTPTVTEPVKKPRRKSTTPAQGALAASSKVTSAAKARAAKAAAATPGSDMAAVPPSDTLKLATHAIEEMKAEETIIIDLQGKTSIADHMIITSGRSNRHVGSIADEVVKVLKQAGHPSPRIEGVPHCDWVLVDCGDVIVHVFRPEVRTFYNLEKMWGVDRPTELAAS